MTSGPLMLFCQQNDRGHFPRRRPRRGFFCKLRGLSIFASSSLAPAPPASLVSPISVVERTRHFLLHAHMTSVPRPAAQSSGLFYESLGAWASHQETVSFFLKKSILDPCVLNKPYLVHTSMSPIPRSISVALSESMCSCLRYKKWRKYREI